VFSPLEGGAGVKPCAPRFKSGLIFPLAAIFSQGALTMGGAGRSLRALFFPPPGGKEELGGCAPSPLSWGAFLSKFGRAVEVDHPPFQSGPAGISYPGTGFAWLFKLAPLLALRGARGGTSLGALE
jgi:hypothetical protein